MIPAPNVPATNSADHERQSTVNIQIQDTPFADALGGFWSINTVINDCAALTAPAQASSVAVTFLIDPTGCIEAGQIQYSAGVVDTANSMDKNVIEGVVQIT